MFIPSFIYVFALLLNYKWMKNVNIALSYIGGYTLEIYVANCIANNIGKSLPNEYYNIISDLVLTAVISAVLVFINKRCNNLLKKVA